MLKFMSELEEDREIEESQKECGCCDEFDVCFSNDLKTARRRR